jgi:hypothetical protein
MGPLPVPLACEVIRQAALGLQHAHENGLVHCDVKPCNLLFCHPGLARSGRRTPPPFASTLGPLQVKILDFGLARLAGTTPEATTYPMLPPPGSSLAGTPDFMAPEQMRGRPTADIRSDLYSLGCTFYFLLTGRVPFAGGTWSEKLLRHQFNLPLPVSDVRPDVPPAIEAIVHRLLAKEPAQRYPIPAALVEVLEVWLADQTTTLSAPARNTPLGPPKTSPAQEPVDGGPRIENAPPAAEPLEPVNDLENLPDLSTVPPDEPRTPRSRTQVPKAEAAGKAGGAEGAGSSPQDRGPAEEKPEKQTRRRWPSVLAWGSVLALAVAAGWGAWQLYPEFFPLEFRPAETIPSPLPISPAAEETGRDEGGSPATPAAFTLASTPGKSFARLHAALAAARDGDTLVLDGDGPFRVGPLSLRGKALTLQAAAGRRPRLTLRPEAVAQMWQPLLTTNRPLVLEGVELAYEVADETMAPNRAAYLIYSEQAPLRLTRCRLLAPRGCALIVCRQARQLIVRDCALVAESVALSVEADAPPPEIQLIGNTIDIREADGAALSLWGTSSGPTGPARLHLENNTIRAGRVVALTALPRGVDMDARDNRFTFRQALLSVAGVGDTATWRQHTHWQGRNNRYESSADWLAVEGQPGGVRGLAAWRAFWPAVEPGSVEAAAPAPPAVPSPSTPPR